MVSRCVEVWRRDPGGVKETVKFARVFWKDLRSLLKASIAFVSKYLFV